MKIAFTADLHQPITPLWQIEQLVNEISEFGPDVLILGGDLAESV
jgi:Icc-related predicted phosphoesterase